MAYFLRLNDEYSIYRKRGTIGLWHKNPIYGYDAAIDYVEKLTPRKLTEWAKIAGVEPATAKRLMEDVIRKGGNGMIPQPDYVLS